MTIRQMLKQPAPEGWTPKVGEPVVVPSISRYGAGWSAFVTKVLDDIVEVRVPMFRNGRQTHLLRDTACIRLGDSPMLEGTRRGAWLLPQNNGRKPFSTA